jgi:4a-hydroxytetrahydrobiopterin dehydratase
MSDIENLSRKTCEPCKRDVPPLQGDDLRSLLERLGNGWQAIDGHHLWKEYAFKNFRQALAFTNRIGEIAEEQGHHPDIELGWGRVGVKIFTHNIDGLSESDFVLAAKFEECAGE